MEGGREEEGGRASGIQACWLPELGAKRSMGSTGGRGADGFRLGLVGIGVVWGTSP